MKAVKEVLGFLCCGETLEAVVHIETIVYGISNAFLGMCILGNSLESVDRTAGAGGGAKWENLPLIHSWRGSAIQVTPEEAKKGFVLGQEAHLVEH